MSFAIDTNVLLRSIDVGHAAQPVAQDALIALRDRNEILSVFPQNLIEFWAVATRPVANNGLGLTIAQAEKELANLRYLFLLLPDTERIFREWEQLVTSYQVIGKQAHDTRIVAAMLAHSVGHLLTFNTDDFKRYDEITVIDPKDVNNQVK